MYILTIQFQNALQQTEKTFIQNSGQSEGLWMYFTSAVIIVPLVIHEELFRAVTQTVSSQITKYVR